MTATKRILMILTSHDRMPGDVPTGTWMEEFAVPYLTFTKAGYDVNVVSVAGGTVPVDPNSAPSDEQAGQWQDAIARLDNTSAFTGEAARDYDAVFMPGGHGTVFDMPENQALHQLLLDFWRQEKVVAAVCHGPVVFTGMKNPDGSPFVAGKRMAAFTDAEEHAVGAVERVPFLLESRLKELGAIHLGAENWAVQVVRDGNLVTGQNPASSQRTAETVLQALAR